MNSIMKAIPVALIAALVGASSAIGAQPADIPERGPIPFAAYDKDGSGFISPEEFNAVRGQRMATRAAEGRPMRGAASAPAFSAFDAD
ncbi:MAG: hypothetical protein OQL16_01675, partial [Gammaproteobacteria bacterium]|nr:hypothetical protein [Gammaproteobacteria bacterium]